MKEDTTEDSTLSTKAEAAFRQATKKVIQLARQTGTPVVVWQEDHVAEISVDQLETSVAATEPIGAKP
jgi:hypothetical protein